MSALSSPIVEVEELPQEITLCLSPTLVKPFKIHWIGFHGFVSALAHEVILEGGAVIEGNPDLAKWTLCDHKTLHGEIIGDTEFTQSNYIVNGDGNILLNNHTRS